MSFGIRIYCIVELPYGLLSTLYRHTIQKWQSFHLNYLWIIALPSFRWCHSGVMPAVTDRQAHALEVRGAIVHKAIDMGIRLCTCT